MLNIYYYTKDTFNDTMDQAIRDCKRTGTPGHLCLGTQADHEVMYEVASVGPRLPVTGFWETIVSPIGVLEDNVVTAAVVLASVSPIRPLAVDAPDESERPREAAAMPNLAAMVLALLSQTLQAAGWRLEPRDGFEFVAHYDDASSLIVAVQPC